MQLHRPGALVAGAVYLALSALTARTASTRCDAPRYFPVVDVVNADGAGTIQAWVPPAEFTFPKVRCLVETLRSDHPNWNHIVLLLFSSREAAANFDAGGMNDYREVFDRSGTFLRTENIGHFRKELRAIYFLDTTEREESLVMTPLGLDSYLRNDYDTTVKLPTKDDARCRLAIANRCVLAFQRPEYPKAALAARHTGDVTVTGTIDRAGKVSAQVEGDGTGIDADLTRAVLDNIHAWWLEPAPRVDRIRSTYSFVIDTSRPAGQVDVELSLPNRIVVRGNP